MTEESQARPRRRRSQKLKKVRRGVLIAIAALIALLSSPLFAIQNVEVNQLEYFTGEEVCDLAGVTDGANLFWFNRRAARRRLEENPYIARAIFRLLPPHTLQIQVTERKLCGYIPYLGAYLYIDAEGRVLEVQNDMAEAHPVVQGLRFSGFQTGQIIEAENTDALAVVVQISKIIQKYEMDALVLEVDVSDPADLTMRVHNVVVRLGDSKDLEDKLRTMYQAVQNIPEGDRGTLDLRDLDKPIIFQYLT